jgi:cellulose synthase (UDP-forming)
VATAGSDQAARHRPAPPPDPNRAGQPYTPQPPTDAEKVQYFGAQHRWIFLTFFAAFAGIMYGMWRLALNSMWTSLLYELMAVEIAAVLISQMSSTRKRRDTLDGHRLRVARWRPVRYPSIDVFLPTAGEPIYLLANTYRHVAAMRWPGRLRVYVLDDAARDEVAALAGRFGYTYVVRPNRGELKKAGNLRYGYEHSDGEFIQIFDADFVPRPEMALELMPYFDDPSIAIVQSPQYFDVNVPTFNWLQRAAGATQELFYRWVQPARDSVDAAICVGTNAIYRRSALAVSGGFAQIGHSEDVHTGVNLAKVGYRTRYVPVNLAKGICPENLDAFASQQYRWCSGSMGLLADAQFHRSNLTLKQKLCFWTGFLYYMTSALAPFTIPLPGLLMLWCFPHQIRPMNYLPMIGTIFVWSTVMPRVTDHRWSPLVVRIQVLIGFCHAIAFVDLLRGRTTDWVPTGAAPRTTTARRVTRTVRIWLTVTLLLTWSGIGYDLPRLGGARMWATVLFAIPMLYFELPLLLGDRGLRWSSRRAAARATVQSGPGRRVAPAAGEAR